MFFKFITLFFAASSVAASTVPIARQAGNAVTCTLVLDPQSPVSSSTNLESEFNLLISRNLAIDVGGDGVVNNEGATFSANADGTFNVEDTVSADGESGHGEGTGDIIEGWVGEVKTGFTIDWLVEAASCN
ncbi:hypothetical protein HYPSUDRAFT_215014 [Hypholoma sublateritium FD-334 SS-4]|uniref:Uncharacterized protein n=1 Tax=Hypholoma sublateritium (strain FD-334 SS-4) TaxID=945553 RepID=A0A0D2PW58_HYPSF|nr:hypothetical protein HYPSUDRAFT_215014 [Hypholoma sublateritium FD-334 SS-4]